MALTDFLKFKKLAVEDVSGQPTISRTLCLKITSGDDSATGTGEIVLDWSNIASKADIGVYDEDDNLLDYYFESFDDTAETAVIWVFRDWVQDGSTQLQVAYGDGPSDQSVSASTVFGKESGLKAGYLFNEDSGDLKDISGNSDDGNIHGSPQGASGIVDGAYEFDRSNGEYVSLPDGMFDGLFDGNHDFSIEAILSAYSFPSSETNVDSHTFFSARDEHSLLVQLGDSAPVDEFSMRCEFSSSGWDSPLRSGAINKDQFYHLLITYNTSDGFKMYLDGSQVDSSSITEGIELNTSYGHLLGSAETDKRYWDGKGDLTVFYSTTLTSEEVKAKRAATKPSPDFFSQQAASALVVSEETTKITSTSATLNGTLNDLKGESSLDVWFDYTTDRSFSNYDSTSTQTLTETGSFSADVANLTTFKTYYVRAAATNGTDTWYGGTKSFIVAPFTYIEDEGSDFEEGTLDVVEVVNEKLQLSFVLSYEESFEDDFGDWYNNSGNSGDGKEWSRNSGGTGSSDTGPGSAYDGSHYVYVEVSSASNGDEAILQYDLEQGKDSGYIDFWLHMYGSDQGTLYFEGWDGSDWNEIWSISGDQGNEWFNVTSPDTKFYGYSKIRFRNVAAGGYHGDVSLDLIKLYSDMDEGNRVSPEIDLSFVPYVNDSLVSWTSDEPAGTSINIETRYSTDGGTNWSDWAGCTLSGTVSGSENIYGNNFLLQARQKLYTDNTSTTPTLSEFNIYLSYKAPVYQIFEPAVSGTKYTLKVDITDFNNIDEIYTYFEYRIEDEEEWSSVGGKTLTEPGEYEEDIKIYFYDFYEYRIIFEYQADGEDRTYYSDSFSFTPDIELESNIKSFTETGEFLYTLKNSIAFVDILCVAGGGGGGKSRSGSSYGAGGGGAGGLIFKKDFKISGTDSTKIKVGAGGQSDGEREASSQQTGENGEDSIAFDFTAIGGGGGSNRGEHENADANSGRDGGSGGGHSGDDNQDPATGLQPDSESSGYGNDGGEFTRELLGEDYGIGGGGGGASESGNDATPDAGDGLNEVEIEGVVYNFTELFGTDYGELIDGDVWFAGGGGGGRGEKGGSSQGGKGGGADGDSDDGNDGTANTGGGGSGGGDNTDGDGGTGGSGIVLLKEYHDSNKPVYNLEDPTNSGTVYNFNLKVDNVGLPDELYIQFQYREVGDDDWISTNIYSTTSSGTISSEDINLDYTTKYEYKALIDYNIEDTSYNRTTKEDTFFSSSAEGSIVNIVEHIEVTLEPGELEKTISLTKKQNINNCVPFITTKTDQKLWYRIFADVYFNETLEGDPQITIERGHDDGTITYSIEVVEFNEERVRVQQGEFDVSSSKEQDITLDHTVDKEGSALISFWKLTSGSDSGHFSLVRNSIETEDEIQFYREGTDGDCTGHWYLFESVENDFVVQHLKFNAGGNTKETLDNCVDLLNTFILNSFTYTDSNDYDFPKSLPVTYLNRNTKTIRCRRLDSSNSYHICSQIITFNDNKIHVPFHIFADDNETDEDGFNYTKAYNKDNSFLKCNLDSSMVIANNFYGIGTYDSTNHNAGSNTFTKLKFIDEEKIDINNNETGTYFTINVIDWNGIEVPYNPRQNNSKSLIESIEKFNIEKERLVGINPINFQLYTILLNNNQNIDTCVPFATYTFETSDTSGNFDKNGMNIIKGSRWFVINCPANSRNITTRINLQIVEFNKNRFNIQYVEDKMDSTTHNLSIEPVDLSKTFTVLYFRSDGGNNYNQLRLATTYNNDSEISFIIESLNQAFFTCYIIENTEDDFTVYHEDLGSTGGDSLSYHIGEKLSSNNFEFFSYTYSDSDDYDSNASSMYKLYHYPRSYLHRFNSSYRIENIHSEQININNNKVRAEHLYISLDSDEFDKTIDMPFNVNKYSSICFHSAHQQVGGLSADNHADMESGYIMCEIMDENTIEIRRDKAEQECRWMITVLEFPTPNKYYMSGNVIDGSGLYVERDVRAYSSIKGELTDYTTSTSGTFYLESPYDHMHHVVCHDNSAEPSYNDLIYGKIEPVEITPLHYFDVNIYKTGDGDGVIEPEEGSEVTVEHGHDKVIDFEPDDESAVDYIEHDGTQEISTLEDPINTFKFYNIKEDKDFEVKFSPVYDITTSKSGLGSGETTPSGVIEVIKYRDRTFEFSPDSDSALEEITITNASGTTTVSGSRDSYTIENVLSDTQLDVKYSLALTVTLSGTYYNDAEGTYSPDEPKGVLSGEDLNLHFYPDEYVIVEQLVINGDRVYYPGEEYTLENIQEDTFVEVVFTLKEIEEETKLEKDVILGGSKREAIIDITDDTYGSHSTIEKDEILGGSKHEV